MIDAEKFDKLSPEEKKNFADGMQELWDYAFGTGGGLSRMSSFEDFMDERVPGFEHLLKKF